MMGQPIASLIWNPLVYQKSKPGVARSAMFAAAPLTLLLLTSYWHSQTRYTPT